MKIDMEWEPLAKRYQNIWADAGEDPWMPGAAYGNWPGAMIFMSPAGVRHFMFDRGYWYRVYCDRYERVSAADAIKLRPSDAASFTRWSQLWMIKTPPCDRSMELADEVSEGIRETIKWFADLSQIRY